MGVSPDRVKLAYTMVWFSGLAGVVLAGRLGAGQPVAALAGRRIAAAVMGGTFRRGQGACFQRLPVSFCWE